MDSINVSIIVFLVGCFCVNENIFFRSCCCSCVLCEEGNLRKVKRGEMTWARGVYDDDVVWGNRDDGLVFLSHGRCNNRLDDDENFEFVRDKFYLHTVNGRREE